MAAFLYFAAWAGAVSAQPPCAPGLWGFGTGASCSPCSAVRPPLVYRYAAPTPPSFLNNVHRLSPRRVFFAQVMVVSMVALRCVDGARTLAASCSSVPSHPHRKNARARAHNTDGAGHLQLEGGSILHQLRGGASACSPRQLFANRAVTPAHALFTTRAHRACTTR